MNYSNCNNGFDYMRRLEKNQWSRIYIPIIILISFLFVGVDCESPEPPPPVLPQYTYTWTIDTMKFDLPNLRPPDRFVVQSIWGSSPHDVWAVSPSDLPWGELWHYDGKKWKTVQWPWIGTDEIGLYGGYLYATTGFDSANVFFFGSHDYNDSATAMIMKWNGNSWSDLPWSNVNRPLGSLGWGVKQNNDKLWAIGATGLIIKYEDGFLSAESLVTNFHFFSSSVIAALDNGEVYINPFKDSLENGRLRGSITKLYKRDILGNWSLIEDKFIAGAYYDDNGLGRGLRSIGNRLFTGNYGLWERQDTGWIKRMSLYALGAWCLTSENDLWTAFKHELYHYNGKTWEKITIPLLSNFTDFALYGQGWSDGNEVFIGFQDGTKSYVLHGKKIN
ncbi:MAG: hypothetical protein HYZ34_08285 [Ignavibacteriae bacterium]|nr:hypothetical protein [Ignavibacteriota bacterium]